MEKQRIDLITLLKHEGATPQCRAAIKNLWEDVSYMIQCRKRYLKAQEEHRDVHRAHMELKLALDSLSDSIAGAQAFYAMEVERGGGDSHGGAERGYQELAQVLSLEIPREG